MAERDRPHIIIRRPAEAEPYRRPLRKIEGRPLPSPDDRRGHASRLAAGLRGAVDEGRTRKAADRVEVEGAIDGIYVVFESFPGIDLALESLDPSQGKRHPELMSVREVVVADEVVEHATVFVPDGKLGYFLSRLERYFGTADQKKPRHVELVDRIRSVGLASLTQLWTDPRSDFPAADELVWWEVWLRRRDGKEVDRLKAFAEGVDGIELGRSSLGFVDRTVVLVRATADRLAAAMDILDDLAELRRPREPAEVLEGEPAAEQAAWVQDLVDRTRPAADGAPAACIVDTGVHQAHPLLQHSLDSSDCHACDPSWNVDDHHGHGTTMAGLALYGDLGEAMLSNGDVRLRHRLESVKLLPRGDTTNPRELWGAITATAASLVEVTRRSRRRVFSMAVSAPWQTPTDDPDTVALLGQPTSWSAAVDALAAGLSITTSDDGLVFLDEAEEAARRLFLVAAGNVEQFDDDHLTRSDVEPVEDPGQAWNALTVGAYTDKANLVDAGADYDGWTCVARPGDLSPFSRTSVGFESSWPVKPDVVVEGGNLARSPNGTTYDTPAVLQILTTKAPLWNPRLLTVTRETSAATAQTAHLAATILAEYPSLWPETVRALIVHSAEWTPAMQEHFRPATTRGPRIALQRRYGMGVPSAQRALRSAADALTLIVQDVIHPFDGEGRMREMHLHDLPWPVSVLEDLGAVDVRLRVTLSYFVEPNPARRGWRRRFSYASHGLRFDVRRPAESTLQFRQRINHLAVLPGQQRSRSDSDAPEWFFGPEQRTKGSLHTDIWKGPAVELAQRGVLAVYPVTGWWKLRKQRDRSEEGARYALVVSIETPEQDVDIWTPVAQEVGVPVEVER